MGGCGGRKAAAAGLCGIGVDLVVIVVAAAAGTAAMVVAVEVVAAETSDVAVAGR